MPVKQRGWALKDVRTGKLCNHTDHRGKITSFYGSYSRCWGARFARANYGHETVIVPVVRTWTGKVKEATDG